MKYLIIILLFVSCRMEQDLQPTILGTTWEANFLGENWRVRFGDQFYLLRWAVSPCGNTYRYRETYQYEENYPEVYVNYTYPFTLIVENDKMRGSVMGRETVFTLKR